MPINFHHSCPRYARNEIRLQSQRQDAPAPDIGLGKVEGPLTFLNCSKKPLAQDFDVGVVGQLYIVRTSHDGNQEIVRCVWRFAGFADNSEHGIEALESYNAILVSV